MRKLFYALFFLINIIYASAQTRSFDDIFPGISDDIRVSVFENSGFLRSFRKSDNSVLLGAERSSAIDPRITNIILAKNPLFLIESINVIPAKPDTNLLDIYNALGNIGGLKGRLYPSHSRGRDVPLFEDAMRILSENKTTAIPDPPPALRLPGNETIYIRLKDTHFGNTYYRAEIEVIQNGLRYTLTNFKNITYFFIPVIKEEKFTAQLYIEPIDEGILIYSVAGTDIADMISTRIDIESSISKRLAVITSWAADGISGVKK